VNAHAPITAEAPSWPPDYVRLFQWRQRQLILFRTKPEMLAAAKLYYKDHPVEFIEDWVDTYDPRNAGVPGKITRMPFVMFPRQRELTLFLYACLQGEADGLIEKCRDAGATWLSVAVSVHLWLFWDGISIGWGSRKEQLVDKLGDMDSIFEKIRAVIRGLPPEFLPAGFSEKDHMTYMRVLNPASQASITGEAGNNIGRGGRKRIYFKDESAHYERPDLIEAALGDNTRVQIDISSVNGTGNVFHRRRENGVEWEPGKPVVKGKANVFVFDWRHHPEKTLEWYNERRQKAEDEGLLHIFAQEVDRDYSSSVEGRIIPKEWIQAAVDAHVKLQFLDEGKWVAGLDVADGGGDRNALAQRRGVVLKKVEAWGAVDTGVTARRAVQKLVRPNETALMYDCIGVGAGVKSEFNRLRGLEESGEIDTTKTQWPPGLRVEPWNAGLPPLFPEKRLIKGDKSSPLIKDHYLNIKAQAWWELRARFWKTFRAITEGIDYDTDDLISIDSAGFKTEDLAKLIDELAQATSSLSPGRLKLMVDKTPEGTRSPNMADAVVMAFWPVMSRYTLENVG
jgi:phage terminase large subunit